MITCYHCVVGSATVVRGQRGAGDGFGTCDNCWVHACKLHGSKIGGSNFKCVGCITDATATVAASPLLTSAPTSRGGPISPNATEFERTLLQGGPFALMGYAPGVSVAALPLIQDWIQDSSLLDLMGGVLSELIVGPDSAGQWATTAKTPWPPEVLAGDTRRLAAVLGVFVADLEVENDSGWFTSEHLNALSPFLDDLIKVRIDQLCEEAATQFARLQPDRSEAWSGPLGAHHTK